MLATTVLQVRGVQSDLLSPTAILVPISSRYGCIRSRGRSTPYLARTVIPSACRQAMHDNGQSQAHAARPTHSPHRMCRRSCAHSRSAGFSDAACRPWNAGPVNARQAWRHPFPFTGVVPAFMSDAATVLTSSNAAKRAWLVAARASLIFICADGRRGTQRTDAINAVHVTGPA